MIGRLHDREGEGLGGYMAGRVKDLESTRQREYRIRGEYMTGRVKD